MALIIYFTLALGEAQEHSGSGGKMRAGKERRKEMGGRDEEGPERDEGGGGRYDPLSWVY